MNTRPTTNRPSPIHRRRLRGVATLAAVAAVPLAVGLPGAGDVVDADIDDTVTPLFGSEIVVLPSTGTPLFDSGLVVENSSGPILKDAPDWGTATPIAGSPLVVRG